MARRGNRRVPSPHPDLDDHLVRPGSRAEILRGELLMSPGADPPHATRHCDLTYVLRAHAASGYTVAVDMLTRTSADSDFAPDASVFPSAPDPTTGKRQLEELAFEVAAEQSIGVPSEKARELVRRGVRRVFCVLVKKGRVLEWSAPTDAFSPLRITDALTDRCFTHALPVAALLDAAAADAAVVTALVARGEPTLRALEANWRAAGLAEGKTEGKAEGKAEAILLVLAGRGIRVDAATVSRIAGCTDPAQLDRWLGRAGTVASARALFGNE